MGGNQRVANPTGPARTHHQFGGIWSGAETRTHYVDCGYAEVASEVPVMTLCEKYLKYGVPFKKMCKTVGKVKDWLRATVKSLMIIQKRIVLQAMNSLPLDDRQWMVGERRQTEWNARRDNPTTDFEGSSPVRKRRSEPELRDLHYHIFGLAGAGDVDYKRQLIKVLQESVGETNQDMLELANRTEKAPGMMTEVTKHLANMEQYLKQHHEWIVTHFNYMEITDNALQTFDLLLSVMLEDRLGAVAYIQDLIDKSYAFRRGIQALLQGKLTIDMVLPTMIIELLWK